MKLIDRLIGIVGPCKSGKSTLHIDLSDLGYNAKTIAQEHSFVPHMWKTITNPDILIYLDVDYETTLKRSTLNWKPKNLEEQKERLIHARENADYYIESSNLTPKEVLELVTNFLETNKEK